MASTATKRASQAGFTMTEIMMASIVAMIVLMAVAMALTTGITANRTVKGNEQATGLANQVIEDARNRPFDELTVARDETAFAAAGTGLTKNAATGDWYYTPSAGATAEKMESPVSGGVLPFKKVVNDPTLGVRFTVYTYVTLADSGLENLGSGGLNRTRRVTTIVSYKRDGATLTAKSSTVITRSRRGLPEPKFEVTPTTESVPVGQGGQLVLTHTIRNLGITDTYDLAAPTASRSWTSPAMKLYADTNNSGLFEAADDVLLTDTNANGYLDTGSVATDAQTTFFIVRDIPAAEPLGSVSVSTTVTSGAHNTVSTAISDTAVIGVHFDRFYPYNQAAFDDPPDPSNHVGGTSNTDTATWPWPMPMDPRTPITAGLTPTPFTELPDFSAELTAKTVPGRLVYPATTVQAFNGPLTGAPSAAAGDSYSKYVSVWHAKLPVAGTYGPVWHTQIYLANTDKSHCDDDIKLKLYMNKVVGAAPNKTSLGGTVTNIATATVTLGMDGSTRAGGDGCAFRGYSLYTTGITPVSLAKDNWLQFRIVLGETSAGRSTPIALSYAVNKSDQPNLDVDGPTYTEIARS